MSTLCDEKNVGVMHGESELRMLASLGRKIQELVLDIVGLRYFEKIRWKHII